MANLAIRSARKAKKLTIEQLAADIGISVSQLSRIERGERQARFSEINAIADRLGLDVQDLIEGSEEGEMVPVVGYVGAGAAMTLYSEGQGEIDRVPAPDGSTKKTVAVIVRGTSLGELFDQWLVYYDQVHTPPTPNMIGRLCVVGLADGRILVKKLTRGQIDDRYTLLSNTEPPFYDAPVEWAALVKQMSPR